MAAIAGLRSNDVAHGRYLRPVGNKRKDIIIGRLSQLKLAQVPPGVDPNRVGRITVVIRWSPRGKSVDVLPVGHFFISAHCVARSLLR